MAVETRLGEWLEEVRLGRGETTVAASAAIGISSPAYGALRTPGPYLHGTTREKLARYLDVDPEVVDVLYRLPASRKTTGRATDVRIRDNLSQFGWLLDRARHRRHHDAHAAAAAIGISHPTLVRFRKVGVPDRVIASTWEPLAAYAGVSVERALQLAAQPASQMQALPVRTWVGTKRVPTVECQRCERCPFLRWCREDVLAGDFAWCEDVAPEDFMTEAKGELVLA